MKAPTSVLVPCAFVTVTSTIEPGTPGGGRDVVVIPDHFDALFYQPAVDRQNRLQTFFQAELDNAFRRGITRILISGAADYALLARIVTMASRHNATPEITVLDRCETPLRLNSWYAKHVVADRLLGN